jgi:hypothetical protein
MDSVNPRYRRAVRALLAVALVGAGTQALAADPAPLSVVVIDETKRGWDKGVLDRLGIASRASTLNSGPHAEALRKALGDSNVRLRLATPTGCPAASTREACASVRLVKDVDLPAVIDETKGTVLILWPEAAYFPQEKLYLAYLDVDVIRNGKAVPGAFYLGYRDWECADDCVQPAFEASAKELAAMVRHMLELGPAAHTRAGPQEWLGKPLVNSVSKWANTCATKVSEYRVVREYGQRFWLKDPKERALLSTAWGGCNIFDAGT